MSPPYTSSFVGWGPAPVFTLTTPWGVDPNNTIPADLIWPTFVPPFNGPEYLPDIPDISEDAALEELFKLYDILDDLILVDIRRLFD
jgi:hypothetical protein